MPLEHPGEAAAAWLMDAVERVIGSGLPTPDVGGTATAGQVAEAVRGCNVDP
jgi:isocitrate/isopropylmalate dehydrogenase